MTYEYKEKMVDNENAIWILNKEGESGWQVVYLEEGHKGRMGYSNSKVLFMRELKTKPEDK